MLIRTSIVPPLVALGALGAPLVMFRLFDGDTPEYIGGTAALGALSGAWIGAVLEPVLHRPSRVVVPVAVLAALLLPATVVMLFFIAHDAWYALHCTIADAIEGAAFGLAFGAFFSPMVLWILSAARRGTPSWNAVALSVTALAALASHLKQCRHSCDLRPYVPWNLDVPLWATLGAWLLVLWAIVRARQRGSPFTAGPLAVVSVASIGQVWWMVEMARIVARELV